MANADPDVQSDRLSSLLYSQTAESKFGGYKQSLLLAPLPLIASNFLLCSKCESILKEACTDPSQGQFICKDCIEDEAISPAISSRSTISDLGSLCPLSSRGCGWEGTLSKVEEHVNSCPFYRVECRNNCGGVLMRQEMEQHLLSNCILREIKCELCGSQFHEKQMNEHFTSCPEFLVKCQQCNLEIKRGSLESHTKQKCENALISCEYSLYGCEVKVGRSEMAQHLNENKISHLEMKIAGLNSELLNQKEMIGVMQERDFEYNKLIDDITGRICKVETNCMINPTTFYFEISGLQKMFDVKSDVKSEFHVLIFNGCLGYYELMFSCYITSSGHLNLGIRNMKGNRDEELEWPLKATSQVSLLPCVKSKNEHKMKDENITLISCNDDGFDIPTVIASIGKSYALGHAFYDRDSIRVRVTLQTSNPLLNRKPQYFS